MNHLILFIDNSKNFYNFELFLEKLTQFVETEKKSNPTHLITVIVFNSKYDILVSNQPLENFDCSTIQKIQKSNHNLALYDTLAPAISKILLLHDVIEMKNQSVKAVVLTSGRDVDSTIVNQASMMLQIAMAKNKNWKFFFASTDMVTALIFKNLNCDESMAYNLDEKSLTNLFSDLSTSSC